MDDVSSEWGVACDGPGCDSRNAYNDDITRLEFHTSWGHYTWYRWPSQELLDVHKKVMGHCAMHREAGLRDWDCPLDEENPTDTWRWKAWMAIVCTTNVTWPGSGW